MLKGLLEAAQRYGERRALSGLRPSLEATLAARAGLPSLADGALAGRARALRERPCDDERDPSSIERFAEACALAAESARRSLRLDPRPEQILAAAALCRGHVAELPTGEGKSLAAALAASVEVLAGRHVHVIPPNAYLASRDAAEMAPLFEQLGISVADARPGASIASKIQTYRADVVYGSGSELGFDFLRDPLRLRGIDRVQRGLDVAILDEVDSLLLDEALTPLVLGGGGDPRGVERFRAVTEVVEQLRDELDYGTDERGVSLTLTEAGEAKLTELLRAKGLVPHGMLYDEENADVARIVSCCLRARAMRRDYHYLVADDGTVLPLDRHTGRAMQGRRWGDGLHQAIEAKERVDVRPEHATRAVCAYARFLGSYAKVVGMTGTARGTDDELAEVHDLRVVRIPPHVPCVRVDEPDRVFLTEREKLEALAAEVDRCHRERRPVMVGTPSEEKAALVGRLLAARGVPHRALTAKHHADEAGIVAEAGRAGAVTIATQVAGRGTDIVLGAGDPEEAAIVRALGGLRVLGLERHASRRVDDQLRGRCGRGGDPGSTCFFVSLEDDLLARHAEPSVREAVAAIAEVNDEVAAKVRRYLDEAQARVEVNEVGRRKTSRKLDAVYEEQRKAASAIRMRLLSGRVESREGEARPAADDPFVASMERALRAPIESLVRAHVGESEKAGLGATIRPRLLRREAYRLFGCEVDLPSDLPSAERAVDVLVSEIGSAFAGQWMRLRAIVRRVMTAHVQRVGPDRGALVGATAEAFGLSIAPPEHATDADLVRTLVGTAMAKLRHRAQRERMRRVLRYFRLVYLDELEGGFAGHLDELARLRDEIGLRRYVREDPLVGYKRRAYDAFRAMLADVEREAVARLLAAPPLDRGVLDALERQLRSARQGAAADAEPEVRERARPDAPGSK